MSDWLDVSDTTPRIAYTATASQTAFVVPFVFFSDSDLVVYQNESALTLDTDYTVDGAEDEDGGSITLLTGATVGDDVMIVREIAYEQTTHIPPSGPLDVPAINIQFSKLVAMIQQVANFFTRSIHFPDSDSTTSGELAAPATRANKILGFDQDGAVVYTTGPSFVGETATGVAHVDSRGTATVTTFDVSVNIVATGGYATPGDGGAAVYKRVVSQPSHAGKFQSADLTWWEIAEQFIDPKMLGAKFDDSTDDGTALNNSVGVGLPIRLPSGVARISGDWTIDDALKVVGAGWAATEIKFTAADKGIKVTSPDVQLSDFKVTSTIAAASRTSAGIKITSAAGPLVLVERVRSNGHLYGIWNQGPGNEFRNCHTGLNSSHGMFLDGSVSNQNEVSCSDCQSNSNGGTGFYAIAGGSSGTAGVFFYRPTAATNAGDGIALVGGVNDVYIVTPELSQNGAINVNASANGTSVSITIVGGLIERSTLQAVFIGQNVSGVTITGVTIGSSALSAIVLDGADATITGNLLCGAVAAGGAVELGAHSSGVVIVGNKTSFKLGGDVALVRGLLIDAGAAAFTLLGNDLTDCTTALSGSIPAGSIISNNKGLTTHTVGAWTANADAAVNGYVTVVDSSGTSRKLATIA